MSATTGGGVIRWEDPPERNHGTDHKPKRAHDWSAIGRALRRRPGRWAVIAVCGYPTLAGATAYGVRNGTYRALPPGRYEAVSRTVDGECRVYARYLGGAS